MKNGQAHALASVALAAVLFALQAPAGAALPPEGKPAIAALPFALDMQGDPGAAQVDAATLVLVARKGSDLYINSEASEMADNTARVLFQPAGRPATLSSPPRSAPASASPTTVRR